MSHGKKTKTKQTNKKKTNQTNKKLEARASLQEC
jgi:hypothetical protein